MTTTPTTDNLDVPSYVRENAGAYDILVVASPIGTGRNGNILRALAELELDYAVVNAVTHSFAQFDPAGEHSPLAPGTHWNKPAESVLIDDLTTLDDQTLDRAIDSIIAHSATTPYILSETLTGATPADYILERLERLFSAARGTRTIRSTI